MQPLNTMLLQASDDEPTNEPSFAASHDEPTGDPSFAINDDEPDIKHEKIKDTSVDPINQFYVTINEQVVPHYSQENSTKHL